ncbi:hypothetical protein JXB11_03000 [Candidatus Woesearchaeota archaeon]|nr:hypothetical protein [Candidatus Woesearchaeota archaeon]
MYVRSLHENGEYSNIHELGLSPELWVTVGAKPCLITWLRDAKSGSPVGILGHHDDTNAKDYGKMLEDMEYLLNPENCEAHLTGVSLESEEKGSNVIEGNKELMKTRTLAVEDLIGIGVKRENIHTHFAPPDTIVDVIADYETGIFNIYRQAERDMLERIITGLSVAETMETAHKMAVIRKIEELYGHPLDL